MSTASAPVLAADVRWFALDVNPHRLEHLHRLLCGGERSRAERLRFRRDAERFVAGRGLLRLALGERLGCDPAALRFGYGPFGKPFLPDEPRLRFNASGSQGVGLLAMAWDAEVGVDVELGDASFAGEEVAHQFFAPAEVVELLSLGAPERQPAFLRCWTRKEAYVKALGDGLQVPLDRFVVSLLPGEPAALRWSERGGETARWTLLDVSNVALGAYAALCVDAHGAAVTLGEGPR